MKRLVLLFALACAGPRGARADDALDRRRPPAAPHAARSSNQLLQGSHVRPGLPAFIVADEKYRRLPIIWGPSYATGVAVSGGVGALNYAFEAKHASLSSRPEAWNRIGGHWRHPTVSGRVAWKPNQMWTLTV